VKDVNSTTIRNVHTGSWLQRKEDHAPEPKVTTDKIIVSHILIFTFFDSTKKHKNLELNGNKNSPIQSARKFFINTILISSCSYQIFEPCHIFNGLTTPFIHRRTLNA
jgi:hypothetical protein